MVFSRVTSLLYMGEGHWAMEVADLPNAAQRAMPVTNGAEDMKKFLFILILILVAIGGIAVWLAGQATKGMPEPGEIRLEVEDVF
ncbi:MAG: hypothetical protein MRY64_02770 [Hyphomonadaceae bacterium]|nr:hypothetical protein [Hyphomonadaceae bacterium]